MCIAAAVGGVLAAGATVYGAEKSADAADDAAKAQGKSGDKSIAFQRESRDLALENLSPFVNFATGSIYDSPSTGGNALLSPSAQTANNFDSAAYLAANPDVSEVLRTGMYKGKPAHDSWLNSANPAFAHWQQYGQNEGRDYSARAGVNSSGFDRNSPMAKYRELLDPTKQAEYLTSNPIFQAAINQFGTKAKNTLGFGGMKGDLANEVTKDYVASGNKYIDAQLNRLLNPIQIGQSSAAGVANTALTTGQSIGDTMTDVGNAQAAGIVGGANAKTQGINSLLSAASTLGGAYYGGKAA
jgi:hypothetical protein